MEEPPFPAMLCLALPCRFGRKKAFLLIIVVNLVGGIGAAFPGTYEGYIAWRGIVGTVYPAIFQTPFIMCEYPVHYWPAF